MGPSAALAAIAIAAAATTQPEQRFDVSGTLRTAADGAPLRSPYRAAGLLEGGYWLEPRLLTPVRGR